MLKTKDGLALFTQSWKVTDPKALLVLTHGYNDHSSRFAHVGKAFNDAGYSLYAYDVRGHGKSGGQRGHTPGFECFLDDLEIVIEDTKTDMPGKPIFVYGHSMGGNITLNYAIRRPVGVSGVIVTGPWLKLAFEPPAIQLTLAKVVGSLVPTFSQKANLDIKGLSRDERVQEAYRDDPLLHGIISVKLITEITNNGLDAIEHAGLLKLPVLLMHGDADPVTSALGTRQFFERATIADKTLKLYQGMRHEIHNEYGKEGVFADMVDWLDAHL